MQEATEAAEKPIGNEIIAGRPHDHLIEDLIDINKEKNGAGQDRQNRPYNMPAQYLQVVDETHL